MADQLGKSIGDLYRGALVPGLMLTGLYAVYVLIISMVRPAAAPALPLSARTLRGAQLLRRALLSTRGSASCTCTCGARCCR